MLELTGDFRINTKITECILCRNPNAVLTEEHIFPESAGGKLKAKILCKDCNSKLGTKVDSPYLNQKVIELARATNEIKGKKGRIPQPLSATQLIRTSSGDIEIKLDSKFHPRVQPRAPKVSITEEGSILIEVSRDISQKSQIPKYSSYTNKAFPL